MYVPPKKKQPFTLQNPNTRIQSSHDGRSHRECCGGTVHEKLGDMSSFDAFMDFNAHYYTAALETYIKAFEADDVPLFKTQWDYEDKT